MSEPIESPTRKADVLGCASALRAGVEDFRCMDPDPHPAHPAGIGVCPGFAHADCAEAAAWAVLSLPPHLGDEGWQALEDRAADAGYEREAVRGRRRRDDFTTATIEAAYQQGLRRAVQAARELGATGARDASLAAQRPGEAGSKNASKEDGIDV